VTFEIELNGRTRAVSVERVKDTANGSAPGGSASRQFRVTIDGEPHLVDAIRLADGALSLLLPHGQQDGGASHHVAITEGPAAGDLTLVFPAATVQATVNGRRVRRSSEAAGAAGEQRILAPMPGRVLRVLVAPGVEVAARQPLVVVEAMKMENELSSPKAGHVKDVLVTEGQSVEAGRLLVIVE
jgi:biotin carboxyl carrier protein